MPFPWKGLCLTGSCDLKKFRRVLKQQGPFVASVLKCSEHRDIPDRDGAWLVSQSLVSGCRFTVTCRN